METKLIEALRREGKPLEPDTLISIFDGDQRDAAADAIARMLADGRLLLTRKRKLALPEQTGLTYGRIQGNPRGFAFFLPEQGGNDLFIPADAMHGAMHGDMVWVRETDKVSRGGNAEAEVTLIALRAQNKIVGVFEGNGAGGYVVPDDPKQYMDVLVRREDAAAAKTGDKVVTKILDYPDGRRPLTGRVVEVLGSAQDAGCDILSVIRRLELPDTFTKPALKLAHTLNKPVDADAIALREDMRGITAITIDGADAKDLDDAVSCIKLKNGNCLLGVHIADVSEYVAPDSALDREAYLRGTSVYFPDRVLPMLPPDISNGVCSLNAGEDKLTLSCMMELDAAGRVIRHRIVESAIRTAHRMTYDDVNAIFAGDEALSAKYADITDMLGDMRALAERLNAARVKRGSIDFDLDEARIEVDETGKPISVSVYERGAANRMIEEFMLIANETVAKHAQDMELPFLYRVHESPSKDKLMELNTFLATVGYGIKNINNIKPAALQKVLIACKGAKEENVISRVTLRSLKRARYCEQGLGHFGLAAEHYCHFTSPIRRYPDLIVHRLLKQMLHGELIAACKEDWNAKLAELARHCSEREQVATEAERAVDDMKKCEYMHSRIGSVETGLISGVIPYGFFVQLSNTVEGLVRISSVNDDFYTCDEKGFRFVGKATGRVFRLGDEVRIKVVGVDMENANIDFELYRSKGEPDASKRTECKKQPRSNKASGKNGGTKPGKHVEKRAEQGYNQNDAKQGVTANAGKKGRKAHSAEPKGTA